jgi:hypothetical protein
VDARTEGMFRVSSPGGILAAVGGDHRVQEVDSGEVDSGDSEEVDAGTQGGV